MFGAGEDEPLKSKILRANQLFLGETQGLTIDHVLTRKQLVRKSIMSQITNLIKTSLISF